jgi:hypothetical protein
MGKSNPKSKIAMPIDATQQGDFIATSDLPGLEILDFTGSLDWIPHSGCVELPNNLEALSS